MRIREERVGLQLTLVEGGKYFWIKSMIRSKIKSLCNTENLSVNAVTNSRISR